MNDPQPEVISSNSIVNNLNGIVVEEEAKVLESTDSNSSVPPDFEQPVDIQNVNNFRFYTTDTNPVKPKKERKKKKKVVGGKKKEKKRKKSLLSNSSEEEIPHPEVLPVNTSQDSAVEEDSAALIKQITFSIHSYLVISVTTPAVAVLQGKNIITNKGEQTPAHSIVRIQFLGETAEVNISICYLIGISPTLLRIAICQPTTLQRLLIELLMKYVIK